MTSRILLAFAGLAAFLSVPAQAAQSRRTEDGAGTVPGETVDIPSISKQAKRAAILMSRLAKQRR